MLIAGRDCGKSHENMMQKTFVDTEIKKNMHHATKQGNWDLLGNFCLEARAATVSGTNDDVETHHTT